MATAKMLTLIRSPRWLISALASSRKRSSVPSLLRASAHQCPRFFAQALISALASSRKRSSEVVPFRECAIEEELQGIRCVDLHLGERFVRDVGVVGDQEWRPVPRATVLLAGDVGQSAAVGSAGRV